MESTVMETAISQGIWAVLSAQSWSSGPGRAAAPLWPWWLWTRALSSAILTASR